MNKININDVPNLLESKKITEEQAVKIVWTEIYIKPYIYGLEDFDEDQKSDFLIDFSGKIHLLFKRYNKELGAFSSFIRGCVVLMKSSWKKRIRKQKLQNSTMSDFIVNNFKNESYETETHQDDFLENVNSIKNEDEKSECKTKIRAFTVLALTLKACRDVDDKLISKISDYTGMKKDALQKLVQEMKNVALENEDARQKLIERRDNAFYFRRKYGMEMNEDGISKFSYENLKERYEHQTKNWIKSNELLTKRGMNGPTNIEVAKKLGLKPRTVGFYLFCAKKNLIKNDSDLNTENAEDNDSLDKN